MNIHLNNYESFFLDYHEGTLNPLEVAELLLFLEQHVELQPEFEKYENFSLTDNSSINFENKSTLKKEITENNRDEYFFKSVENTINFAEEELLNNFLLNYPNFILDYEFFHKTKLKADLTIQFENKNTLKRKSKKAIPFYNVIAIAASVLLILGFVFIINRNVHIKNNSSNVLAVKKQINHLARHSNKCVSMEPLNFKNKNEIQKHQAKNFKFNKTAFENKTIIKVQKNDVNEIVQKSNKIEEPLEILNEQPLEMHIVPVIAQIEEKKNNNPQNEFPLLRELATTHFKENLFDDKTIDDEKRNGNFKRFSGWDILQLIAKATSKITGKKVEVKPKYNEQGDVTAFALNAGKFEMSRIK